MKRVLKMLLKDFKRVGKYQLKNILLNTGPLVILKVVEKTVRNYIERLIQDYGISFCINKVIKICDKYGYDKEKVLAEMKQRGREMVEDRLSHIQSEEDIMRTETLKDWYDDMVDFYGPNASIA